MGWMTVLAVMTELVLLTAFVCTRTFDLKASSRRLVVMIAMLVAAVGAAILIPKLGPMVLGPLAIVWGRARPMHPLARRAFGSVAVASAAAALLQGVPRGFAFPVVAVLAVAVAGRWCLEIRDRRIFGPPGRVVNTPVGARHVVTRGGGDVTVVFENGTAGSAISWGSVLDRVSPTARVIAYDRQALGWSRPGAGAPTSENVAAGLRHLLDRLEVTAPVVLVGMSQGGHHVRVFARRFPDRVAALVLVDPSIETSSFDSFAGVSAGLRVAQLAASVGVLRLLRHRRDWVPRVPYDYWDLPSVYLGHTEHERRQLHAIYSRPGVVATVAEEFDTFVRNSAQVVDAERGGDFPGPLSVVRPGLGGKHEPLVRRTRSGSEWSAFPSGHAVQFDAPEVVAQAILDACGQVAPRA
jgi:pimeloyl-ACP methyl ester carboxylesterase